MNEASGYIPHKANSWNYEIIESINVDIWGVELYNKIRNCRK